MKFLFIYTASIFISFILPADFLSEQKKSDRVRTAIKDKQSFLENKLKEYQLSPGNLNLLFIAYKDDDVLDVYAKSLSATTYQKLLTYKICARSGELGPKMKQGDGQVPEGFYHINQFNANSKFYLSLGINYPNRADSRRNKTGNPGGDIFMHGSCVTIGCLPMTDNFIKEIYLLAVFAKNNGQAKIPVYIFPFKMTGPNMTTYKTKYKANKELVSFWENLKTGYDKFQSEQKELNVIVNETGDYMF